MNNLEMRSRSKNPEIHVVSFNDHKNPLLKINDAAILIHVPEIGDHDIEAYHRLPAKANKTPAIFVRFQSQTLRDLWLQKKSVLEQGSKMFVRKFDTPG